MFPTEMESQRLEFTRLSRDSVDVFEYYRHCSAHEPAIDEVTQYLPWDPHRTVNETGKYIESMEEEWRARTRAEYVMRPKSGEDGAGEIAGSAGLLCRWEKDLGVFAIWLRKPFWGRGYSGERADRFPQLAFEHLDLGVVAIPLVAENENSYRAVEKYVERHGGRHEGRLRNHAGRYDEPRDNHRFSISQDEYISERDA